MPRAFDGLRVLDATHVVAGPFAAYQLAVPGAEVIKIDRPDDPGQVRLQGPDWALNASAMGTAYHAQGGGKRSPAPDLKTEDGRAALLALPGDADAFVQTFRPGALEALGLGYKKVAAINPRLVYCPVSAFGHTGPRREAEFSDEHIAAMRAPLRSNSARIRPPAMTITRSESPSSSGNSHEMTMTPSPRVSVRLRIRSWISDRAPTSKSRVGWSRISTLRSDARQRVSTTFCWFPPESEVTGASSNDALRRTCLEMPAISSSALARLKQPRLETFCGTQSTAFSRMVCISGSASCLRSPGARPMGTMK